MATLSDNIETKYSQGPWTALNNANHADFYGFVVLGGDGTTVADCNINVGHLGFFRSDQENQANHLLIAASRDLLDAVRQIKLANELFTTPDHIRDPDAEWQKAFDMIDAAIAKATGQSS